MKLNVVLVGAGVALLESKLSADREGLDFLTETFTATEIVASAAALSMFIANRVAQVWCDPATGLPASSLPDHGLSLVFAEAHCGDGWGLDDSEAIRLVTAIYLTRDSFLSSLATADIVPAGDIDLVLALSPGWDEPGNLDVIIGVALALERLFLLDMASSAEDPDEDDIVRVNTARLLGIYRDFAARSYI